MLTKHDQKWWTRFGELEEYKKEYGGCNVPINYAANLSLAKWVMNQRAAYERFVDSNWKKSSGISAERIDALNNIGFEWRLRNRPEWDERYDEVVAYKQTHGDTLVPMTATSDATNKYHGLALWVMVQRNQYRLRQEGKHSHLTDDRLKKLNGIGFVWNALPEWDERYDEVVAYKQTHGDTLVPMTATSDATNKYHGLALWVMVQRKQYRLRQEGKHSHLTNDRLKKLNGIGFVWNALDATWENRFFKLQEFKANHGHTDVPNVRENKELYSWVARQRRHYKEFQRGKPAFITNERIEKLKAIGFEWR